MCVICIHIFYRECYQGCGYAYQKHYRIPRHSDSSDRSKQQLNHLFSAGFSQTLFGKPV